MLFLLIAFPDGEGKDTGPLHNIPCMVPRPEGLVLDLYVRSGSVYCILICKQKVISTNLERKLQPSKCRRASILDVTF